VDNTIVTVALPRMRTALGASFAAAQWTVDAYQPALGALLLTAGAAADRWGRRRVLQVGLAVFTAASALCRMAPTVGGPSRSESCRQSAGR
jgi:MFS family permease